MVGVKKAFRPELLQVLKRQYRGSAIRPALNLPSGLEHHQTVSGLRLYHQGASLTKLCPSHISKPFCPSTNVINVFSFIRISHTSALANEIQKLMQTSPALRQDADFCQDFDREDDHP